MEPLTMMAISSALSALGGGMSLFGKKKQSQLTPAIPPEMLERQKQLWGMGMQGMQDPTAGFDPIAQREVSRFQSQTVPSIAERFTSMGQGSQRSSAFTGALGEAGTDLGERLGALGSQYGLQRTGQLQQLLGMGIGSTGDYIYQPEQLGGLQQFGATLGAAATPMIGKAYEAYETGRGGGSDQIISLLKRLIGGSK